jgi:hypothetical protein
VTRDRRSPRVVVLWRGNEAAAQAGIASNERFRPVFAALEADGATAEPFVYRDEIAHHLHERLLGADGVLVWVDPVSPSGDRTILDQILREVADKGVWVGSHPDVIDLIGTKEVLFDTREVGWTADVHRYTTVAELRSQLPDRLRTGARVVKPRRGNGGLGVWKVELRDHPATGPVGEETPVSVQHALIRDLSSDIVPLGEFLARCEQSLADGGCLIDQPFQPRVAEGLRRVYLVVDDVVGFSLQGAGTLLDQPGGPERVMGLPSPKTMLPPDHEPYQHLRRQVEAWLREMQRILAVPTERLPFLWDADFLLGPATADGDDTYVLCEINASCITPFPPEAPARLAAAVTRLLT